MKEVDKTKKNIRINEIDDSQRKELFNKFKGAGGKVLTEREENRKLIIDREKQRNNQKRLNEHYNNKRIPSTSKINIISKNSAVTVKKNNTTFDKFRIRFQLRISGITGIQTVFFKKSFFRKFNEQYKPSLIQIQMIYLNLFKKDYKSGNRIIRSLDKVSPLYYELIEKSGDLFKPYLIEQILENYNNFPDIKQPLSELRESMIELYRMLYILKPYENTLFNSYERSIELSISQSDGKKDKSIRKKDLKNSLFIIFNKLYPRLHILFCYYQGMLFSESDKSIEELLSITPLEKPGNRIQINESNNIEFEVNDEKEISQNSEKEEINSVGDEVKEGLKLMYKLDNRTLRNLYDKKKEFEFLNDMDKVLLTYMLFLEFEKEYSFILTTNKIKYITDYSSNEKIDFKAKMQDLFNQLKKCQDTFKQYYEVHIKYNKTFNEKPMNNNQYIAYSKRLDEISKQKKQIGSMSRMIIKSFMDRLSAELKILIEDMNGKQKYISNPQDLIEFVYEIEGDKKLNNKKIYEAIEIVYNYSSALSYRIGSNGDLSGKLEFEDNENSEEKDNNEKKQVLKESILDELDDII